MYRHCVWYKYIKEHHDTSWEKRLAASCHVNTIRAKYFLLTVNDESVKFIDAAATDDDS